MLIKPALQNRLTKNIYRELNVPLTFNKAPNLHSVTCSEMNNALQLQTKDYCKKKGVVISSCFLWKLLLLIGKGFPNLLYNPLCGL